MPSSPSVGPESNPISPYPLSSPPLFLFPFLLFLSDDEDSAGRDSVSSTVPTFDVTGVQTAEGEGEGACPHVCPVVLLCGVTAGGLGGRVSWNYPLTPRPAVEVSPQLSVGLYSLMSSLLSSFISGASLTPALYIPKAVWHQTGRKVQGLRHQKWPAWTPSMSSC